MIKDNLEYVGDCIEKACHKAGRQNDVLLLAVSKTKPVEELMEAYNAGVRDFGENYVQELCDKIEAMPQDIRWHMIGHLQRNKVKYIVGKVEMIHSVDSVRLAQEISKEAVKKNCNVKILIEVNVAAEDTKFGVTCDNAVEIISEIAILPGIKVCGLMTSAPYVTDAEENRKFFQKLKQLSVDIRGKNIDNVDMDVLSMGMTNDYAVAVEEGASIVRVGTAIFGERSVNK